MDAYGHVSVRHPGNPERFFVACSRSPELVARADLIEYGLDCVPVQPETRVQYSERFIHGAIYRARPDVMGIVHNHAADVIPFSVTGTPIRPLLHTAACIGGVVPIWDISKRFGDTDLLVRNAEQGDDLAAHLAANTAVLMRCHGCTVVGRTVHEAVRASIYLRVNARLQCEAMRMGPVQYLSQGEIDATGVFTSGPTSRVWEYWSDRAKRSRG